jgi:hypothetical protein
MQIVFKTYFLQCNIWFKYVKYIKKKVDLFFGEVPWLYNDVYVITSYMYISLNFLMKK